MYCNQCETQSLDTSKFCSECGTELPLSSESSQKIEPIEDPYWDDILPEIENEIYAIPRDNIIKIIGSIFALFAVTIWLICML